MSCSTSVTSSLSIEPSGPGRGAVGAARHRALDVDLQRAQLDPRPASARRSAGPATTPSRAHVVLEQREQRRQARHPAHVGGAALVAEQLHRDRPALTRLAEQVRGRHDGAVEEDLGELAVPYAVTISRASTPGVSSGTNSIDSPRCAGASGSVRSRSMHHGRPHALRSSRSSGRRCGTPGRQARRRARRACGCPRGRCPRSGSLKPWHQRTSHDSSPGRCSRFCSSVPNSRMALVRWPIGGGGGAPAAPISSLRIAS